jgi:hypothetical protein
MLSLRNISYAFLPCLFFSSFLLSQTIDIDDLSRFDYQYEFIFFNYIEFNEEAEAERFNHELPVWPLELNKPKILNRTKAISKNIDLAMNKLHKLKSVTVTDSNQPYSQPLRCYNRSVLCLSEQLLFNSNINELVAQVSEAVSPIKMLGSSKFLLTAPQQRITSLRPYKLIQHIGFLLDTDEIISDFQITDLKSINSHLSGRLTISNSQPNRVALTVSWISDFNYSLITSEYDHLTTFEGIKKYIIDDSQTMTLNSIYYFDHPAFGVIATVNRFDNESDLAAL